MFKEYIKFSDLELENLQITEGKDFLAVYKIGDYDDEYSIQTHTMLRKKLPGYTLFLPDYLQDDDILICFSVFKESDKFICFKLITDNAEPSKISCKEFADIKELYQYLFANGVTFSDKFCADLDILTPQQVFLNYLREKNIYLLGFWQKGFDENGYTSISLLLVKKIDNDNWVIFNEYFPVKDFSPNRGDFDHPFQWSDLMDDIIDNTLYKIEDQNILKFYEVLYQLEKEVLVNFSRNLIVPFTNEDIENVSFLEGMINDSDFLEEWQ